MKMNMEYGIGECMNLTQKLYRSYLDPVADRLGLKRVELDVLLFLANNPEHDTATDVVEYHGLVKSHVSAAVNRLEELGYLERYYYNDNHRTIHLELTQASHKPVEEARKAQKAFGEVLFAGINEDEIATVKTILSRVLENVQQNSDKE